MRIDGRHGTCIGKGVQVSHCDRNSKYAHMTRNRSRHHAEQLRTLVCE